MTVSNSNSCGGEPSAGSQGKLLPSGWGETSYASALGLWYWRGGDGSQGDKRNIFGTRVALSAVRTEMNEN